MSDIFAAYLAGEAREIYADHFADAEQRGRAVARAARPLAPAVAAVLARQNAKLAPSSAREENLAALRAGAPAVVTGQQVGLFLGPLFTFYKAASAVAAARALSRELERAVVPLFWLQTEDHDLLEIAECHVPCAGGPPLSLRLPASPADRVSIAHLRLPAGVDECRARLRAEIDNLPHAESHLACIGRHYRAGGGWAEAFAGVLAEMFAADGLVLLDARDAELGALAAPIHRRAIEEAAPIANAMLARRRWLEAAGYAPPVHVRAGAPLSFFHPRGSDGPRYRLEPVEGGFAEVGGDGVHSPRELLSTLEREPLCFSTSALLRPILQDSLLPTAMYVGGPAEVAYFAQLAPLYEAYGMTMPMILPRARLGVVEGKTRRTLARLGLEPADASRPEEELLARAAAGGDERLALETSLLGAFEAALAPLRAPIEAAGPGLGAAIEKTHAAVATAVSRLAAKYDKARLHRDAELVAEVRRLKDLLYPRDVPQERFYGISYFAARYGERAFLDEVLATIEPFDPRPRFLFPADESQEVSLAQGEAR